MCAILTRSRCLLLCFGSLILSGCRSETLPQPLHTFNAVGTVCSLTFSPDGKYLVAGSEKVSNLPKEFWQGKATVWNVDSRKEIGSWTQTQWVKTLDFSPDGKYLALGCGSRNWHSDPEYLGFVKKPGEVVIFGTDSWKETTKLHDQDGIHQLAFSPDGTLLATSSHQSSASSAPKVFNPARVKFWDVSTWKERMNLPDVKYSDVSIAFSPDGKMLAVGDIHGLADSPGRIKFVAVSDGTVTAEWTDQKGPTSILKFTPDGKKLVVNPWSSGCVELREVGTGKNQSSPELTEFFANSDSFALSNDGKLAAGFINISGRPYSNATVLIWDLETSQPRARWTWTNGGFSFSVVCFSPASSVLAVGTTRGEVKLFCIPAK